MKTIINLTILFTLASFFGNAQVKDISVTLSPAAEYTWWDNQAGLNDGALVGGKLGFSFGEFLELRGVYLQSYDLETNFKNFGLANYNANLFAPQDVTLTRWGGEFKANIGTKKLRPYLTLGTGVQSIEMKDYDKLEQVYTSLGLGLKLNLFPRTVFLVEGKNTTYNFNAGAGLLTSADKNNFGVSDADFSRERLSNWAVQGALQFYLGGREPGTMTDLDMAYLTQFRGGLSGLQLIIEPGVNYIDFKDNSLFRDTWFVGGYAGVDFNKYFGVRAFYFEAIESMDFDTDFDNLSMYGLEVRANLNDGNGVTPYLTLGGGYLNPKGDYLGEGGATVDGGEFASGGLGLNIPLGKRILINGGARAMLTSGESALDVSNPDDIQTHILYSAGIKFSIGKKSKSPDLVYRENFDMEVEKRLSENELLVQQMKSEYQNKVNALEKELKLAYEDKDVDRAVEIIEEKNEAEESLKEVEKLENKTPPISVPVIQEPQTVPNVIQMSPAELESLIVNILKATSNNTNLEMVPKLRESIENEQIQMQQIESVNKRIDLLQKLLLEMNIKKGTETENVDTGEDEKKVSEISDMILEELEELEKLNRKIESNADRNEKELKELNRKVERNADRIDNERNKDKAQTIFITPTNDDKPTTSDAKITSLDEEGKIIRTEEVTEPEPMLRYKNSSAMLGFNTGGATTVNIGARLHYDIINSPLEFMPEIYIGFGNSTSFGVSGNIVYPISIESEKFVPYVGAGLGFARIDSNLRGNYNLILGTHLPFIHENLSVDYTIRNLFKYNQLAVTYRLPF